MKVNFNSLKGYGIYFSITLLFVFLMISCRQDPELPEDMVAQVNGEYLLHEQLEYSIPSGLEEDVSMALRKEIISKWIENDVFYQAAVNEGLKLSKRDQFFVDEYRKALFVQDYLDQKLNRNYKIPQKEINSYYEDHKDEFIRRKEEVHVIHLLLEQRDNAIFREIGQSDDLLAIIKKYYFDQKSTKERPNNDLGYVELDNLPDSFVRTLRRMRIGAVSQPVKSDQGYHFLQLVDRQKEGSQRDQELVKNEILIRLKRERRLDEKERLLKSIKDKAQIQTYLSKIQD